jgi:hypothetical protein
MEQYDTNFKVRQLLGGAPGDIADKSGGVGVSMKREKSRQSGQR